MRIEDNSDSLVQFFKTAAYIAALAIIIVAIILGTKDMKAKTYMVYQTPDEKVVRVVDPNGKEVDVEKIDLSKIRYEIFWVAPEEQK